MTIMTRLLGQGLFENLESNDVANREEKRSRFGREV